MNCLLGFLGALAFAALFSVWLNLGNEPPEDDEWQNIDYSEELK